MFGFELILNQCSLHLLEKEDLVSEVRNIQGGNFTTSTQRTLQCYLKYINEPGLSERDVTIRRNAFSSKVLEALDELKKINESADS